MSFLGNLFADVAWDSSVVTILLPVSLQSGSFFPLSSSTIPVIVNLVPLPTIVKQNLLYYHLLAQFLPNAEEEKKMST
jgi:hypothetical protein